MDLSIKKFFFPILAACLIAACKPQGNKKEKTTITIHQSTDAKNLNPVIARDAFSNYVCLHLFQSLVDFDYETEKVVGILAEAEAETEIDSSGNMLVHYQIRETAKFDDGSPIDAEDVLFSLKAHLCPGVESYSTRFFKFIEAVKLYPNNSRKVTFVCRE